MFSNGLTLEIWFSKVVNAAFFLGLSAMVFQMSSLGIFASHVIDQIHNAVGVPVLIVIPRHQLDKGAGEHDASLGIKDGGMSVSHKVGRNNLVFSVFQESFHWSISCLLDLGADLIITGLLAKPDSQVDDGDVGGRHAEGHAGQLAVQGRDDLADSFGGTG